MQPRYAGNPYHALSVLDKERVHLAELRRRFAAVEAKRCARCYILVVASAQRAHDAVGGCPGVDVRGARRL